jgi:hypothetical protein
MKCIISQPLIFRNNIKLYFAKMFDDIQFGTIIELGIYNYTLKKSHCKKMIKKLYSSYFVGVYNSRLNTVLYNLKTKNN